ncbi:Hypothetical predicted protein [Mytilus galloprovincialis]|uniref:Fibrinogen C-terminal domain-containing protein n=1 Tax=Mytilus galloprovincialis TaxID=29158 RepID=A0A8B6DAZ1_MYTGA|nr:Hypothetical predicted protein [Mytilus galloprovincialis]
MSCTHSICKCDREDYWSGSVCLEKKPFNTSCSKNGECKIAFRCLNTKCKCLQTEVWDGIQCTRKKEECEDIQTNKDGVYTIYPGGGDRAVLVYCIMRQTKKWTVIQSRVNGSVDFYRTWNTYKNGFGSAYGEYRLGNDYIHLISTYSRHELSIYMEKPNKEHRWGNYSTFSLADEISKYILTVTGYTGNAGFDALDAPVGSGGNANGQAFSTKDRDNDGDGSNNCAVVDKSVLWFNNCEYADLNKPYSGHRVTCIGTCLEVTYRRV